jgi:hypothetical protein
VRANVRVRERTGWMLMMRAEPAGQPVTLVWLGMMPIGHNARRQ